MLIKAHQERNRKCGNIVPQLGTQQKELESLVVPRALDQHMTKFLLETGLTLEQAQGRMEDIPRAQVIAVPYEHEKLSITDEEQISLGT